MKYSYALTILLSITALFIGLASSPVHAQNTSPTEEPTPAAKATETPLDSTVKTLKDKISDKVEQINKKSKKVIKGTVDQVDDATIKIKTTDGKLYTVTIDETITSFYSIGSGTSQDIEQSDIEKGDLVLVNGPVIEDQVSANIIYKISGYLVLQGQITATDDSAFTISVVTQSKDEYVVDIETKTKQLMLDSKTLELTKSGFSKFKVGDYVHLVTSIPSDGSNKVAAQRVLIIPQEYFTQP